MFTQIAALGRSDSEARGLARSIGLQRWAFGLILLGALLHIVCVDTKTLKPKGLPDWLFAAD